MSELYNRIEALCTAEGINITEMCRRANVQRGNLTDLKKGRQNGLSYNNLVKIADYFGITVEELTGKKEKPTPENRSELDEILEACRERSDLRMLFKLSKGATPEDIQKAIKIIEAISGNE